MRTTISTNDSSAARAKEQLTTPFNLRAAFEARQDALATRLRVTANFTSHPTTIGDAHEADWNAMLRSWLPRRYGVGSIFAVDADGRQSQQIDVAVFDEQYAPKWFESEGGIHFVPVESVYAAFEIKPELNKTYIDYAGEKIASVRALRRTSGSFRHLAGTSTSQPPDEKEILGGILSVRSGWSDMEGRAAVEALTRKKGLYRVDLGIALDALSFNVTPSAEIAYSSEGLQLIFFAMRLFERLQRIGTALAVDIPEYERRLVSPDEGA